ncbi:hypothetical protein CRG98_038293 [Punica granatum]|uniref:Uncharacterized protein n=1 Tax=Punica granatum TaxID=22663 RepID=A0A2I0IBE1_PUNGR|nr:hypothetical protein CRG98_038293 [Punica granatum]
MEAFGSAKGRALSHAMTYSIAQGEWVVIFAWEGGSALGLARVWRAPFEVVVGRWAPLSNLSVIGPSVSEVDHVVLEYMPSAFCGRSVRSSCADGLCRGVAKKLSEESLTKTTGKSA